MSAGLYAAGVGPAGADPVPDTDGPRAVTLPRAIYFDGASRSFPFDEFGRLQDIHPVDQQTALAVIVEIDKLAIVPKLGFARRGLDVSSALRFREDVERRLRAAVKRLLDAGDITIVSIAAAIGPRWRRSITFRYFNNRIPGAPIRVLPPA